MKNWGKHLNIEKDTHLIEMPIFQQCLHWFHGCLDIWHNLVKSDDEINEAERNLNTDKIVYLKQKDFYYFCYMVEGQG